MNRLMRESPIHGDQWISIHDMKITRILCHDNSVVFCFEDGFNLIENGQLSRKNNGRIEMLECNSSDFSCHIIDRRTSKRGDKLYGRPFSLEELNKTLVSKKKWVEVFLELYDVNQFYWRGTMEPYKSIRKKFLVPYVIIETMDFFPMVYSWE